MPSDRAIALREEVIRRYGYDEILLDRYIMEQCLERGCEKVLRELRTHPRAELIASNDTCGCDGTEGECNDTADPGQTERYPPEGYEKKFENTEVDPENRIPEGTPADDAALHCESERCDTVEADELGLVEGGVEKS